MSLTVPADLLEQAARSEVDDAAVFRPGAADAYAELITARSQILNQRPELADR